MTTETSASGTTDGDEAPTSVPWWLPMIGGAGALVLLTCYVWLRWAYAPNSITSHGALGDSLAPVAALFSFGALLAALFSVDLQRRELRLQREEMIESRGELKRSADAQVALAEATRDMAAAQVEANRRSFALELVQRDTIIATLEASLAGMDAAAVTKFETHVKPFHKRKEHVGKLIEEAQRRAQEVRDRSPKEPNNAP